MSFHEELRRASLLIALLELRIARHRVARMRLEVETIKARRELQKVRGENKKLGIS